MARSSCPKCGNLSFELQENVPATSKFKLLYIQCSSCGGVVGVIDYLNIGSMGEMIREDIKKINEKSHRENTVISSQIEGLERKLQLISSAINELKK